MKRFLKCLIPIGVVIIISLVSIFSYLFNIRIHTVGSISVALAQQEKLIIKEPEERTYYITTLRGNGTYRNPYKPAIIENNTSYAWGMIDLRPDPSKIDGYCIAYIDTASSPSVTAYKLADSATEEMTSTAKTSANYLLGTNIDGETLPDYLAKLLIEECAKREDLCEPIKPMADGEYRIYLGGQIYGEVRPTYTHNTITDNFNRSDGALGSSGEGWSWTVTSGDFRVSSNQARTYSSGQNNARADSDLASTDHYSQVLAVTHGASSGRDIGCAVRYSSSADTCYLYVQDASDGACKLYKVVTGSYSGLASEGSGHADASNDTMRFEADGTSLIGYWNDAEHVSTTDSSLTTQVRTGIRGYGNDNYMDDFEADVLGGATPDISNTPSVWNIGIVTTSTDYWANGSEPSWPLDDGECEFAVTNNSGAAVDIDIKGSNFTGGAGWTLAGTPDEDTVTLKAGVSGAANEGAFVTLTTGDQAFITSLADSDTEYWEAMMESATSHTDGVEKTSTITLTASLS